MRKAPAAPRPRDGMRFGGIAIRNVRNMVRAGMFAALMAVCAWIAVPVPPVYVTLQTLGVFLALLVLGGKWGTVSTVLYLLLGAVGLPVFSGFRGGIGMLLGVTGGFLWGFAAAALVYWALERLGKGVAMAAGMAVCYLCGCGWFLVYTPAAGISGAIISCVLPYLLPDALKLTLAWVLGKRLSKHMKTANA